MLIGEEVETYECCETLGGNEQYGGKKDKDGAVKINHEKGSKN